MNANEKQFAIVVATMVKNDTYTLNEPLTYRTAKSEYLQDYRRKDDGITCTEPCSWGNETQAKEAMVEAEKEIRENFPNWNFGLSLEEISSPEDDSWDEFNLPESENFTLIREKYEDFSYDFIPSDSVYEYIQGLAEKELEVPLESCNAFEINGTRNGEGDRLFIQMKFADGVIEWEFVGELPEEDL